MRNDRIRSETRLTLAQAAKVLDVHAETIRNWTRFGRKAIHNGRQVTLEWSIWINHRVTSAEALNRFIARIHGEKS